MNVVLRKSMTLEQFLRWEEKQELRYEFDGVGPVAMTGGTVAHDQITFKTRKALDARLEGKPCQPHGPNVKIIAAGSVRYPDVFVTCSKALRDATVAQDPVVVFEVASESTSQTDRIEKLQEYQATPSIQRYVILEQNSIGATVFTRQGDQWIGFALTEAGTLRMPEIGIEVPMPEFYAGVELPQLPESDR
jgi:Uma2 family endonuclease